MPTKNSAFSKNEDEKKIPVIKIHKSKKSVFEVDAMVLVWHADRREDEPWELATPANVEVVQLVLQHRRDL